MTLITPPTDNQGDTVADAHTTDPTTSGSRTLSAQKIAAQTEQIMIQAWARWNDHHLTFTDDDVAEWTGEPRNIAAKVRQSLEQKGRIERTDIRVRNAKQQHVISFRPVA